MTRRSEVERRLSADQPLRFCKDDEMIRRQPPAGCWQYQVRSLPDAADSLGRVDTAGQMLSVQPQSHTASQ